MARADHVMRLSQTNSYGYVAVCACGWVSAVYQRHLVFDGAGAPGHWDYDRAMAGASAEHGKHVLQATPITVFPDPRDTAAIVVNFKRFGHA